MVRDTERIARIALEERGYECERLRPMINALNRVVW